MSTMNMDQAYMYTHRQQGYTTKPANPSYHTYGNSTSFADDRRRRPEPSSPCSTSADYQRKHAQPQQGSAFVYQAMSRTLPRLDELFASEQLIAPRKTTANFNNERRIEALQAPESTTRAERYPGASSSLDQYALSRKSGSRRDSAVTNSSHSHGRSHKDHATRASEPESRSTTSSRPHPRERERAIRVDELLNHSEQQSRRNPPAYINVNPSTSAPPSPEERHDSPIEEQKSFFNPQSSTAAFTPATYVYQAAAYEGIQDVPGIGPHHFYKGGLCIPTHVYGEAVNPMWGLTRGKVPRKRLSVACQTCRAKKIRCEPSFGGCLQCKKAEKPCRVEPVRRRRQKQRTESPEADEGEC